MPDQFISIHGGAYADLKKALTQWLALYSGSLEASYQFELYKKGRGQHLIRVDSRIDNEGFNYLVNYLKYPEGIDYHVIVEGLTTIKDSKVFPREQMDMEILVFIPEDDKEYDNVFVVTPENEVFKLDFGGKLSRASSSKRFVRPDFNPQTLPPPEIVHPPIAGIRGPEETRDTLGSRPTPSIAREAAGQSKRFRVIFLIALALFLLSYIKFNDRRFFLDMNYGIGLALALWLFVDYKILRNRRFYCLALIFSFGILLYGYWLGLLNPDDGLRERLAVGTSTLFSLLILQRPMRWIFRVIMKREPIVDRPAPSVADFLYAFILLTATLVVFLILL